MPFSILLLDDDEEIIATVRKGLDGGDYSLRVVRGGAEAFNAVMESRPDAILAGAGMPRNESRKLSQVMGHLAPLRTVPFLFLGSAGDFLEKPFQARELREKMDGLRKRTGDGGPAGGEPLPGAPTCNVKEMLVDTIELLVATGRSGTLAVIGGEEGRIFLEEGALRHASYGVCRGEEALLKMLALEKVEVSFRKGGREALPANLSIDWKEFAAAHC